MKLLFVRCMSPDVAHRGPAIGTLLEALRTSTEGRHSPSATLMTRSRHSNIEGERSIKWEAEGYG